MAIANIESTGFNSLFQATNNLAMQAVEANTPTPKEKNLKAENRSLNRENISLEAQNKLLAEQNEELEKDNKELSRQVKEYKQADSVYESQYEFDSSKNNQDETRSVEKAKAADEAVSSKPVDQSTQQPGTSATVVNNYVPDVDITGVELGNSFNSFA